MIVSHYNYMIQNHCVIIISLKATRLVDISIKSSHVLIQYVEIDMLKGE